MVSIFTGARPVAFYLPNDRDTIYCGCSFCPRRVPALGAGSSTLAPEPCLNRGFQWVNDLDCGCRLRRWKAFRCARG